MSNETQPNTENRIGLAILVLVILISAVVVFGIDFGGSSSSRATIKTENATALQTPKPLSPFQLNSHLQQPYNNSSLMDKWSILSFGYTFCPDVCPTALATLSQMDDQLKREGGGFPYQVVFVSVDPERDSIERLSEYVPYFNTEFLGVTGKEGEISKFAKQLGMLYARSKDQDSAMGYLVDHSAHFALVNPKGEFHAVFSPPHNPATLAKDLRAIVEGSNY